MLSPDHRSGGALNNIDLDPLDHLMAAAGYEMVRYADDFVILCRTAVAASQALAIVQRWVGEDGLVLHPTKTKIADVRTDGFDFLARLSLGQTGTFKASDIGRARKAWTS